MFLKILVLERGEGSKKERERNIDVREKHQLVASHTLPTRVLAHNLGICLDWESNQQPLGSQASTQSTEPYQPRLTSLTFSLNMDTQISWEDNLIYFAFFYTQ